MTETPGGLLIYSVPTEYTCRPRRNPRRRHPHRNQRSTHPPPRRRRTRHHRSGVLSTATYSLLRTTPSGQIRQPSPSRSSSSPAPIRPLQLPGPPPHRAGLSRHRPLRPLPPLDRPEINPLLRLLPRLLRALRLQVHRPARHPRPLGPLVQLHRDRAAARALPALRRQLHRRPTSPARAAASSIRSSTFPALSSSTLRYLSLEHWSATGQLQHRLDQIDSPTSPSSTSSPRPSSGSAIAAKSSPCSASS